MLKLSTEIDLIKIMKEFFRRKLDLVSYIIRIIVGEPLRVRVMTKEDTATSDGIILSDREDIGQV